MQLHNWADRAISPIPSRTNAFRRMDAPAVYWCVHCERTYRFGAILSADRNPLCPYSSCENGRTPGWPWASVRDENPALPAEPTLGVTYPLFGGGTYTRRMR